MGYQPSLKDIEEVTYNPSLSDIQELNNIPASQELLQQANIQGIPINQKKISQMQEEFSNPTQFPGFQNLSPELQRQRIALSQFDPANMTPIGTFVPPGSYEHPATRYAASIGPTLIQPEFNVGKGMLSHYLLNPLLNLGARIGSGTLGSIAYNLPHVQNWNDLANIAKKSLQLNTLMEIPGMIARTPGYIGELMNPVNYAQNKISTIRNEYQAAKELENQTFKPVMDIHGSKTVSIPKFSKNEKLYFSPKMTKAFNALKNDPTFQNLHRFQSVAGSERMKFIGKEPTKADYIKNVQEKSIEHAKDYLKKYPSSLEQYNKARNITKNVRAPYESTPSLKKISTGKISNRSPQELNNIIKTGTEKLIGEIPEGHALRNHLNDLEKAINFGNLNKIAIPGLAGTIAGNLVQPGLGTLGGAGAGVTLGAGLLSKIGNPALQATIQNPLIQNIFSKGISPIYYGYGRSTELNK